MEVVVPDWLAYLAVGLFGIAYGYLLARARYTGTGDAQAKKDEETREVEREQLDLSEILGIDKALTHRFYIELQKAVRDGLVRVEVVSDSCPGKLLFDFTRMQWACKHDDMIYPLGEKPAGETIIVEEEERQDGGGG